MSVKVKKLKFVKYLDNSKILMQDSKGEEKFEIALSKEILTDLLNKTLSGDGTRIYGPKDIQRKIRQGISSEQISKESGLPIDEVKAFAHPIEVEKQTAKRRFLKSRLVNEDLTTIESTIAASLLKMDFSINDLSWSVYRIDNAPWHINANLHTTINASFEFSPEANEVKPLNNDAKRLLGIEVNEENEDNEYTNYETEQVVLPTSPQSSVPTKKPKKEVAQNSSSSVQTSAPVTQQSSPRIQTSNAPIQTPVSQDELPTQVIQTPSASTTNNDFNIEKIDENSSVDLTKDTKPSEGPTSSKSTRISVPSWDDILLNS